MHDHRHHPYPCTPHHWCTGSTLTSPSSSSSELDHDSALHIIKKLSHKYRGGNVGKKSATKKKVFSANCRKSPRLRKVEHPHSKAGKDSSTVSPCSGQDTDSSQQETSSSSTGAVYDFGVENWDLKMELSPKKSKHAAKLLSKNVANIQKSHMQSTSDKRKVLALNALQNLRNEVTQKSKRSTGRTKARRAKSSPWDQSAVQLPLSRKRPREQAKMVSVSTQTPPKKRRTTVQKSAVIAAARCNLAGSLKGRGHHRQSTCDSGVFMSPPSFTGSLKSGSTSTPSGMAMSTPTIILRPNHDVGHDQSLYDREDILAGAPDLSPVRNTSATYRDEDMENEHINLVTPEYVEVKRSKKPTEVDLEEEDMGYRTLSISKTYANRSFSNRSLLVGMYDMSPEPQKNKAKKKAAKRKPARQSASRFDALADRINTEFDELDNYELSID